MASKKMKGARAGVRVGAKVAPRAGRTAGKLAWKAGKSEAKLIRRAMSAQQSRKSRYFKYAIFTLIGLAIGAAIARSRKDSGTSGESSSFTGTDRPSCPRGGEPAGQRGETWGSGTPTGTAGGGPQATGADRDYSDPSFRPLDRRASRPHRGRRRRTRRPRTAHPHQHRRRPAHRGDATRKRSGKRRRGRVARRGPLRRRQAGGRRNRASSRRRTRSPQPDHRKLKQQVSGFSLPWPNQKAPPPSTAGALLYSWLRPDLST